MSSRFKMNKLGVGLGLRVENSTDLLATLPAEIDCLEIAPENYFHTGGKLFNEFKQLAAHYPIVFHGISLSVGSLKPLNRDYLKEVKAYLDEYQAGWFSDHLCYSSVMGAQFHDLLPLPFTEEAIDHVVPRIKAVQDFLERPFAMENVSSYVHPGDPEMKEWEFIKTIAEEADCGLLLDVNNIYVNSVNFGFDPQEYLSHIPMERVMHIHIAGHLQMDGFLLDTHGAEIVDPVWEILDLVAAQTELPTVIIERDNNLPPLSEQLAEVKMAREILSKHQPVSQRASGGGR